MQINTWLKRIIIGGLFLLPLTPLVVSGSFFFPFISGKAFFFRTIVEIIFVLWAILALRDERYRPRKNLILIVISVFVAVVGVADIFSVNSYKSFWSNFERMEGYITILHLFAYFLVAGSVLQTKKLWERFFQTSSGVSVIVAGYGILQLAGVIAIRQSNIRPDSTLGNATYFGVYMLLSFFIAWLLFIWRSGKIRIVYGAVMAIQVAALYITATRGALLGFIAGLMITALIIAIFEKSRPRLRRNVAIGLGVVLILGGVFVAIKDSDFLKNKGPLSRLASISLAEGAPRFMIWNMALQGFKERPILGWGQESFNYVFNKYYNPKMYGQEQWFDRSHNVFLDWLIAAGIFGFIGYLLLYGAAVYVLWRGRGSAFLSLSEKAVLTGLFGGYMVNNIFVFDQLTSYLLFFSLLAFIYSQNVHQVAEASESNARHFDPATVNRLITPFLVVVFIFIFYFVNIKPMLAGNTLIKALRPQQTGVGTNIDLFKKVFAYDTFASTEAREQLTQISYTVATADSVPLNLKQAFFDLTKNEMLRQLEYTPEDARYQLFIGSFLNRFRMYDEALPYLEKALSLSPKKQSMFFELGTLYLNKPDHPKALELFKQAFELAPEFRDARIIYAVGSIYNRQPALTRSILEPISSTTIIVEDRLVNAYTAIGDFNKVLAFKQKAVEENPTSVQVRLALAAAYIKVGRRTEAIAEVRKAIELDPKFKAQGDDIIRQIRDGWTP